MALPRGGGHAAIGPGQREHSLKRLFGHEHDAQRGAFPRRPRRGQDRDLARRVTGGRRALRPRVPRRESQKECAGNQRQRCRCSPDELACRKHWQSLAPVALGDTIGLKSWQKSIGHANFGRRGCGFRADHAAPGSRLIALQQHQPFPVVERAPLGADRRPRGACRAAALEVEARSDQARHVPPAAALTGRLPSTSLRVAARCSTPAAPKNGFARSASIPAAFSRVRSRPTCR
jgi:hypothetical protein